MKKTQRGLSLIESAIVLGLSAVVISGVLYYNDVIVRNNNRMSLMKTINSQAAIVNKLYMGYGSSKPYDGLTPALMDKLQPGIQRDKEGWILGPGGLRYTISNTKGTYGYMYYFDIDFIPLNECQDYAVMFTNMGAIQEGWFMNGSKGKWQTYTGTPSQIKGELLQACKNATNKTVRMSIGLIA
ncbi:TPA: hypothetical protein J1556_002540 [Escherichia coli]|nr:hypothetical protein [Escherichia coli]HBA6951533.1 hypothetical protein [Escherichia coli]HBA7007087.1 hypothetical protein [Escherichia coli]HBA7959029.1 hypothetical protein [Escherichia coli]HBA8246096.1 hypothetical protein [Escherichia coli]